MRPSDFWILATGPAIAIFTIVDIWKASIFAWETPARVVLTWLGEDTLRFLALMPPPDPLVVILSFIAWTVITFAPLIGVGYVLEELIDALPKKKP